MSGRAGLQRQLGSAEIVAQVVLARRRRAVSKVVFMGMGEPAHNLDNVLEAIDLLGTQGNIGHKNLVFSTVGDLRVFERLMNSDCSSGSNPLQLPLVRGRAKPAPPLTRGGWEGLGRGGKRERQSSIPAVKPALAILLHTPPMRHCAPDCCLMHPILLSKSWWNAPKCMRVPQAIRFNINGR